MERQGLSLVVVAAGVVWGCGSPSSITERETALCGGETSPAVLCCKRLHGPGKARGACISQAARGRGPCGPRDAGSNDDGAVADAGGNGGSDSGAAGAGGTDAGVDQQGPDASGDSGTGDGSLPPATCVASSPDAAWQSGAGFNGTGSVSSLWATSSTDVWAATNVHLFATSTRQVTVQHWNGTTWTSIVSRSENRDYRSLWSSGPNDLWVATTNGLLRWNGTTWADVTPFPNGENFMTGVWGLGPNDVWALRGASGLGVFHWDGVTWADRSAFPSVPPPSDAPPEVVSGLFQAGQVWGAGTADIWMAGTIDYPVFPVGPGAFSGIDVVGYAHWDGGGWTLTTPATLADARRGNAWSIGGTSAADIWAVGGSPGFVEHYDGIAWRRSLTLGMDAIIRNVWGSCGGNVWAAGFGGSPTIAPLLQHYDGNAWSSVPLPFLPASGSVNALTGTVGGDLWIGYGDAYNTSVQLGPGSVFHRPL